MMLFLHLFNQMANVELCQISVYFWSGKPLVYALGRISAWCVPIYLFLSGYGLALIYERTGPSMKNAYRVWKLYVNYWVVMLMFIPLGAFLVPESYPGDISVLLLNVIGWSHSYNQEWWFLFPYVILVVSSPVLFRYLQKVKRMWSLVLLFTVLYFSMYTADKVWGEWFDNYYVLSQLRQLVYCLYSFMWGAMFFRFRIFERCADSDWIRHNATHFLLTWYLYVALAVLCVLRMMLGPGIINPLFAVLFILIFNLLSPINDRLQSFLRFMGTHSTNMWLTHTFFAYYFFKDFIYGLKYPLLMYVVLIILSLLASYAIRGVYFVVASMRRLVLNTDVR